MSQAAVPLEAVAALLHDEVLGVERFVQLLQSEQGMLQAAATDELGLIASEKAALAERLARLGAARNQLLSQAGFGIDREGLNAWAARAGDQAAAVCARLLALAADARELNRLNGQLIALRLNNTQAALAALTPEHQRNTLYGRDGQTSARTGYRIIDSA